MVCVVVIEHLSGVPVTPVCESYGKVYVLLWILCNKLFFPLELAVSLSKADSHAPLHLHIQLATNGGPTEIPPQKI